VTAIVGGQTDCGGNHPSEIISHIKAKRLVPIAVALEVRDPAIPDVPTFKELGYNVVTVGSVKGVAVPKGTPPEVIGYLAERFKKACEDPGIHQKYEGYRTAGHVSWACRFWEIS
jgi:tripartite-type tricarboxylate transporter receptor subunit TctC